MFSSKYDPMRHLYVVVKDARFEDADYERVMRGMTELDRGGIDDQHAVAFLLVVDPRAPAPDARWRQALSAHHARMQSPHVFIALVTRSAVSRGVFTAIKWLTREPGHIKSTLHATVEDAAAWIEEVQGTPAWVSRAMHAEARARSEAPPAMLARAR